MTLHVEDSKGSISFLASVVADSSQTAESVATVSPAPLLAFDTMITLPQGTSKIEGSSCEAAAESAIQLGKELNQSIDSLSKFRCYELYSKNWQDAAYQIMKLLEQGGYDSRNFSVNDSPILYQVWSKENSQYPLHIFFGQSRLDEGLFFVIMRQ